MPKIPTQPNDPYVLIQKLTCKLNQQSNDLSQYKKIYQTSQNQKNIILLQLKKKISLINKLKNKIQIDKNNNANNHNQKQSKFQQQILLLDNYNSMNINATQSRTILNPQKSTHLISTIQKTISHKSNKSTNKLIFTPNGLKLQNEQNKLINQINSNNINNNYNDFIPSDINLTNNTKKDPYNRYSNILTTSNNFNNFNTTTESFGYNTNNLANTTNQQASQIAQNFIQDFIIIGPDPIQLKKKRQLSRKSVQHILTPVILYHQNIKTSQNVLSQIATRCFPTKIISQKQSIQTYQDLKQSIQFKPTNKLSNNYFVITLLKQQQQTNINQKQNQCYRQSNYNEFLYIFVIKLPQFVLIQKDQKHYQRKQQQIWHIQKCYAIATYYPFFDIFINLFINLHQITMKQKLHKIHQQNQKFYTYDLRANNLQIQKNTQIQQIIKYFRTKQIFHNEIIYHKNTYYGKIPNNGYHTIHALTKLTAPIFMSCFSYEQTLLLITGVLCEKSIVFMSRNQSLSTLCALFLTSIITPFPLEILVLNIDQSKMQMMVFDLPFPMIATVKRTDNNIENIIFKYVTIQIQKKQIKGENQRIILVDIDSRSIFYNGHCGFQSLIFSPSEHFAQQYTKFNPSFSKSFSFPKKLTKQNQQPKQSRKRQQIKKTFKQMSHKIQTNQIKYLIYQYQNQNNHKQINKILQILIQYINSFVVQGETLNEALKQLQQTLKNNNKISYSNDYGSVNSNKRTYQDVIRQNLIKRHPEKTQLIQIIINSQYYANYLTYQLPK